RAVQPDDRSQHHRLAGPRAADDAEHLAAPDIEVDAVVDGLLAEAVDEAAHADHEIVRRIGHRQICSRENRIENIASTTITRKIASTTDNVVRRPTLSAL